MRLLICITLGFAAATCGKREAPGDAARMDTAAPVTPAAESSAAPAASGVDSAVAARLVGTWSAQGYDSGSTKPQRFTITWTRAPDGGLKGMIAFQKGEKYGVKLISAADDRVVYESDPHRSPTLGAEVVTHTEAQLSGDSLTGSYEARATERGKTLRGRFTAKRGAAR
jgi:hypothetical protein